MFISVIRIFFRFIPSDFSSIGCCLLIRVIASFFVIENYWNFVRDCFQFGITAHLFKRFNHSKFQKYYSIDTKSSIKSNSTKYPLNFTLIDRADNRVQMRVQNRFLIQTQRSMLFGCSGHLLKTYSPIFTRRLAF